MEDPNVPRHHWTVLQVLALILFGYHKDKEIQSVEQESYMNDEYTGNLVSFIVHILFLESQRDDIL